MLVAVIFISCLTFFIYLHRPEDLPLAYTFTTPFVYWEDHYEWDYQYHPERNYIYYYLYAVNEELTRREAIGEITVDERRLSLDPHVPTTWTPPDLKAWGISSSPSHPLSTTWSQSPKPFVASPTTPSS